MRVLVVDDSADLRDLVQRALTREDHQVVGVADAASADEALRRGSFDLVILDLGLPDGWGATWCQRVRREGLDALVLVLTAHAEVAQRLEVFDAGADDFLAKPFAIAELRARIRALGRRRGVASATVLQHLETEVDLAARRAKRDGAEAPLTAREWSVLECLWVARGRLVPRATLLGQVWGGHVEGVGREPRGAGGAHPEETRPGLDPDRARRGLCPRLLARTSPASISAWRGRPGSRPSAARSRWPCSAARSPGRWPCARRTAGCTRA